MLIPPSEAWKIVLVVTMASAIIVSACAAAPRHAVAASDLRRLVLAAIGLYGVGGVASLAHHAALAGFVFAVGIMICALAVWLSRGTDSEDPPGGEEPVDERPPPEPDGLPELDWDSFERAFRAYEERSRTGVR